MREPQRYIKFSTNFMVTICQNSGVHNKNCCVDARKEKKFRLFLFFIYALSEVVKNKGLLCTKVTPKLYYYVTMGLADGSMDL